MFGSLTREDVDVPCKKTSSTLPETNIAPQDLWLEDCKYIYIFFFLFLLGWPIFRGYVSFRYKNIRYDCESTVPLGITKAFTAFTTSNNNNSNNNNNHNNSNNSVFWCFLFFFSLRWSSTNLLTTHSHAIGLLGRNLRERIWKIFARKHENMPPVFEPNWTTAGARSLLFTSISGTWPKRNPCFSRDAECEEFWKN